MTVFTFKRSDGCVAVEITDIDWLNGIRMDRLNNNKEGVLTFEDDEIYLNFVLSEFPLDMIPSLLPHTAYQYALLNGSDPKTKPAIEF